MSDSPQDIFGVNVTPIDGMISDVRSMQDEHIAAANARVDKQVSAVKYQADQYLLMSLASQIAQQYFADQAKDAALDAAEKQFMLGDRQMIIAEKEQTHREKFYCMEDKVAEAACLDFDGNPDYASAQTRATRNVRVAFGSKYDELRRRRLRYCPVDSLQDNCDLAREESLSEVASRMAAFQMEDTQAKVRREYFDNYRNQASNIGSRLQASAVATYSAGATIVSAALSDAATARSNRYAQAAGGINTLLGAYYGPRIQSPNAFNGSFNAIPTTNVSGNSSVFGSTAVSNSMTPLNNSGATNAALASGSLY